eukprot:GHVT01078678.1.p1 GENE.GHVT01078678.1~~GHVT01078678.1.p1  ORF type:complete len:162 (-),score=30.50 GHVT01078678.1:1005-1490(-)
MQTRAFCKMEEIPSAPDRSSSAFLDPSPLAAGLSAPSLNGIAEDDVRTPGECLGSAEVVGCGSGVYVHRDRLFASACGYEAKQFDDQDQQFKVSVLGGSACASAASVPRRNATVIARVIRINPKRADCKILVADQRLLREPYDAMLRSNAHANLAAAQNEC